MKLRQLPEDFKVEEINNFDILSKGDCKLYLLEKRSLETFSLLRYLSSKNKIPFSEFGIAGLKDKHAVTKQYLTIPSKYDINTICEKNFAISFLGYIDKKLKLGDLAGNKFEIAARDIKKTDLDAIKQRAESAINFGIPNYFDSQRFGSVIHNNFIAKHIIKKGYELAVKTYLTLYPKSENKRIKEEKRLILKNWNALPTLQIKTKFLADVINEYSKSKSWLNAYKKINPSIRQIIVSAYQSYLWNECIKEVLMQTIDKKRLYSVKYKVGSLLFYSSLSEDEIIRIPKTFKIIGENMKASKYESGIIDKLLKKENISLADFDIRESGNFFADYEREILAKPSNFNMSEPLTDELNSKNKNKCKVLLSFSLPKGSYATLIIKRIFSK
ncbi:tRNA pseudouridine(13) synthase TruD [Candidatus Woesearchaeota archaeon]|nr:tRNA pseudouridine(13) synthase TruD [Candidatus Woesearchaeota archaeon]